MSAIFIQKNTIEEIEDVQRRQNSLHNLARVETVHNVGKGNFAIEDGTNILVLNYANYFEHNGKYYLQASESDVNTLNERESAVIIQNDDFEGITFVPLLDGSGA